MSSCAEVEMCMKVILLELNIVAKTVWRRICS